LEYHKILAGSRKHYVKEGEEGMDIKWGATYTLRVSRDDGGGSGTRTAINPGGTYYVVWSPGIQILTEDQIKGFAQNDENPHIEKWLADHVDGSCIVEWKLIQSVQNSTVDQSFEITEFVGVKRESSTTDRLTINNTDTVKLGLEGSKKVRTGAEFTFKELEVTGSLGYEHSTSRERFHETMTHDEIYHSKEVKRKFDLKKGESMFVWQAVANAFGNLVYLDHVAYTSTGDGPPAEPKFDDAKFSFEAWR
jgi:hypothetical protein